MCVVNDGKKKGLVASAHREIVYKILNHLKNEMKKKTVNPDEIFYIYIYDNK